MEKTWLEIVVDDKSIDEKLQNALVAREAFRKAVHELQCVASESLQVKLTSSEE